MSTYRAYRWRENSFIAAEWLSLPSVSAHYKGIRILVWVTKRIGFFDCQATLVEGSLPASPVMVSDIKAEVVVVGRAI
jgi:hypothetical protein